MMHDDGMILRYLIEIVGIQLTIIIENNQIGITRGRSGLRRGAAIAPARTPPAIPINSRRFLEDS